MIYSESECAWLTRRADKIALARGWPLPVARSEAEAELTRGRMGGRMAQIATIPREEELEEDFGGVERRYFVREDPDRAALLDFNGSRFLAERQFPIEHCGKVTLSICSWIVETDAHQAA